MELNFIRFITGIEVEDKKYYDRPYIKLCFDSLSRFFDLNVINIELKITDDMLANSNWCKLVHKRNIEDNCEYLAALSDYYRIYYTNMYDNVLYCDTDVLWLDSAAKQLENSIIDNDEFIICGNTGNSLYNKYKNNHLFKKFLDLYDNIALDFLNREHDFEFWKELSDSTITDKFREMYTLKNIDIGGFIHLNAYFMDKTYDAQSITVCVNKGKYKNLENRKNIFKLNNRLELLTSITALSGKYMFYGNNRRNIIFTDNIDKADIIFVVKEF